MEHVMVDVTEAEEAGTHLGRFEVAERRPDGSLLLVPESVEDIVADTADRALDPAEFLDALDRLTAASSQISD